MIRAGRRPGGTSEDAMTHGSEVMNDTTWRWKGGDWGRGRGRGNEGKGLEGRGGARGVKGRGEGRGM